MNDSFVSLSPQSSSLSPSSPDSSTIRSFFDNIASHYDFLNNILSLKVDDYWRRRSRDLVLENGCSTILDLGTGTGKFLEIFLKSKSWKRAAGLDFSEGMLQKARRDFGTQAELISGDFHKLPFKNSSFDLIISAFALRSVKNMQAFLSGVLDLLTPNGKAAFLCLTRPTNLFWKMIYYPYLKFYLPLVGGIMTGNKQAYRFLSESILHFQDPETTAQMMKDAGFQSVEIYRFTFGMATLITGKK